jgi:hypothetical protein
MDLRQLEMEMKEFGNGANAFIVFDFGVISYLENLDFSFSLGLEKITDIKLNKRYLNKDYRTISRKYGRKLSKIGYPYMLKFDEKIDEVMLLVVYVGEKETDNYLEMVFPLEVHLSKEKPILNIRFLIDEYFNLWISSSRYSKDKKIENVEFTSKKNMNNCNNILDEPIRIGEHMLIFSDVLGIVEDDFKGNLTSTRNRCIIKV